MSDLPPSPKLKSLYKVEEKKFSTGRTRQRSIRVSERESSRLSEWRAAVHHKLYGAKHIGNRGKRCKLATRYKTRDCHRPDGCARERLGWRESGQTTKSGHVRVPCMRAAYGRPCAAHTAPLASFISDRTARERERERAKHPQ